MNARRFARLTGCFVGAALLFAVASAAHACPSCQAALNADGSQGNLARGIYLSILFMMSMPFAIVGAFGAMAYRAIKREQRRQAEAQAQDLADLPRQDETL